MTNAQQTTTGYTPPMALVFSEDNIEGTFLEDLYDALVCNSDEYSDGIAVFDSSDDDGYSFCLTFGNEVNFGVYTKLPYSPELVEGLEQLGSKISGIIKPALN